MSKKVLFFAVLFSLTLSLMITQEASAFTKGTGQYSKTTASLDPSRICGAHICQPGEHAKWTHAVSVSQRQGPAKATGGYNGMVIMHQLVVNTPEKSDIGKSSINSTGSK